MIFSDITQLLFQEPLIQVDTAPRLKALLQILYGSYHEPEDRNKIYIPQMAMSLFPFMIMCICILHHQNKTDRHDLNEILLKVALNTLTLTIYITDKPFTGLDNEYHSECLI